MVSVDEVIGQRLAAQHLTGPPAPTVVDAVRDSLAVQAQDPPLSRFSLGLRTGADDAGVLASLDSGDILRTHVLRPTWHYVARDDLRWLVDLTSAKVLSGMGSRHRTLGVDAPTIDRAVAVLQRELTGRALTRKELTPLLPTTDYPQPGEVVGHLLLVAEQLALICSGPTRNGEHTYALLDDVVPSQAPRPREDAVHTLVTRFVAGHGPTSIRDLTRWTNLTLTELRGVLNTGAFETIEVEGVPLWRLPNAPDHGLGDAWLLPTFDEAFLSHDKPRFPRLPNHRLGTLHINAAEAGGGVIIVNGRDIGGFKRTVTPRTFSVRLQFGDGVTARDRASAVRAAERLGTHFNRDAEVSVLE